MSAAQIMRQSKGTNNNSIGGNIVLNKFCARIKMRNCNTLQKSQQFNPPMRK